MSRIEDRPDKDLLSEARTHESQSKNQDKHTPAHATQREHAQRGEGFSRLVGRFGCLSGATHRHRRCPSQ